MSFARNIPTDSYYDEYVAAMHKIYSERPKGTLTAEDIAERNAKAEEILRGLLGKGNKNDIPVLFDPCVDSDVALIDCNETGEIVALSSDPYEILRVDISKRIYNWDCFNGARKKVRSKCKTALELFEILYELSPDRLETSISQIRGLVDPQTPYSSFAKRYIELKIQDKPYKDVILRML